MKTMNDHKVNLFLQLMNTNEHKDNTIEHKMNTDEHNMNTNEHNYENEQKSEHKMNTDEHKNTENYNFLDENCAQNSEKKYKNNDFLKKMMKILKK